MPTKNINTNKSNSKNTNNINIKIDLNDKPKRKRRTNKPKQPNGVADPTMNYPVIPAVPAPPVSYNTYYPKQETTEPQGEAQPAFDSLASNRENILNSLRNKVIQQQQEEMLKQASESSLSLPSLVSQNDRMTEALPPNPLIDNAKSTFITPQADVSIPQGFTTSFRNPLNSENDEDTGSYEDIPFTLNEDAVYRNNDEEPEIEPLPVVKRGPKPKPKEEKERKPLGRPKGSKNKPKIVVSPLQTRAQRADKQLMLKFRNLTEEQRAMLTQAE